ncbi:MAG: class I SAM-dependent methyltransferase, partial [Bdellovibrionales bacterium]|nr:class I SAM-dependent methyltransferase [Bdellovibrionales bacterium]
QNERNFTRLLTLREVGIKHFIDCLVVPEILEQNGVPLLFPLMDVGTGPGFPGVPLKIALPDKHIYLAEGVLKRVEFLRVLRRELELENVEILARNVGDTCFLPVKGAITRAVEDASNTLGNVVHSLQTGGRVYLMKGPNCGPEIEPALEKWSEYYTLEKDIAYELKHTPHQRRLLVFKKIKPYPLPDFDAGDFTWDKEIKD